MSMLSLIIWLLFLWFLYKAVRFILRGVRQYKQTRNAWEDFYRQATGQDFTRKKGKAKTAKDSDTPAPRRKIFSREDGEYVEFEDIIVSETETTSSTSSDGKTYEKTTRTTVTESQIVDAEWEDIP